MTNWPGHSLLRGIRTTRWPAKPETAPGVTPGRPVSGPADASLIARCPTGALAHQDGSTRVNLQRCISCQQCRRGEGSLDWTLDFNWTSEGEARQPPLPARFRRSLHVRYVDAGACGGCVGEARLIDAPPYNLHRFGIFITASPRDADVLLVAGPVTEAMREPLVKAYRAMPAPKRVVAMGVCAIDGGIFGKSFACAGGVEEVIPVDLRIAGCPPPPLAIIDGLLRVTGRAPAYDGPLQRSTMD